MSARVTLPHWVLISEIPGMPYSEPSFYSIRQRDESQTEDELVPDVVGVAYLITMAQYHEVIASEGGQIAYREVRVQGRLLDTPEKEGIRSDIPVRSLGSTRMTRKPPPYPSERYKVRTV